MPTDQLEFTNFPQLSERPSKARAKAREADWRRQLARAFVYVARSRRRRASGHGFPHVGAVLAWLPKLIPSRRARLSLTTRPFSANFETCPVCISSDFMVEPEAQIESCRVRGSALTLPINEHCCH